MKNLRSLNNFKDGIVHFKTNVGIKDIIGKDLINNDNIAVLELVKNSFDALATKVFIDFENIIDEVNEGNKKVLNNNSRIIIKDNGHGMSKEDIINKWLNIAYSEKKSINNKEGRLMAGAKGVGRFSCDRLGEELNIYTKKRNSSKVSHLYINWKDFEHNDININIEKIDLSLLEKDAEKFFKNANFNKFENGTIIEIKGLRSKWTNYKPLKKEWDIEKLSKLKSDLEKLINPNQEFTKTPFDIILNIEPDKNIDVFNKLNGKIKNTVFRDLDFKVTLITSEISEDGKIIKTLIKDKGRDIISFEEENNFGDYLAGTKITFYYMSPYSKIYFKKVTGIRTINFGSLFLFINGFRIPPYGEEGDDWLGIEKRKGQGYARNLGAREILGRIEVSDKTGIFKIVSSREGLVDNKYFRVLKKYSLLIHSRLEKYVVDGLKWDTVNGDTKEKRDQKLIEHEKLSEILSLSELESKEEFQIDESTILKNLQNVIFQILNTRGSGKISNITIDNRVLNSVLKESNENKKTFIDKIKKLSLKSGQKSLLDKLLSGEVKIEKLEKEKKEKEEIINKLKKDNQKQEIEIKTKEKEIKDNKKVIKKQGGEINKRETTIKKQGIIIESSEEQISSLRNFTSKNFANLQSYLHQISISSKTISNNILHSINAIKSGKYGKLEKYLQKIQKENDKNSTIARFAIGGGMDELATKSKKSLNNVIKKYIENDYISVAGDGLEIEVFDNTTDDFILEFRSFDMLMILDNLLDNAKKAKAKKCTIIMTGDKNNLKIEIIDDGIGLDEKFKDNPNKIFDLKTSSTNGAGIGLFNVKEVIDKSFNIESEIKVKINKLGLTFILTFNMIKGN